MKGKQSACDHPVIDDNPPVSQYVIARYNVQNLNEFILPTVSVAEHNVWRGL